MKLATIIPVVLFGLFGWALYLGLTRENPQDLPTVFLEKPAPALPPGTLDGFDSPAPDVLTQPGLKLVNFWASWCAPCRAEHPNLLRLAEMGWTIIGINKSDKAADATAFINELGNPFSAIATDRTGRQSIDWGVYGLPETFLIDEAGNILLRHAGPITKRVWDARFVPIIATLTPQ